MATKKHEEPVRPKRPSTLISRRTVPAVKAREDLEQLLRVHDPDAVQQARSRIKAAQLPLLRRIAADPSAPDGAGLIVRKHAILLLGLFAAAEDVNALASVARIDPDPAIRAEALFGLARSGVALAAPVLVDAIASSDPVEAAAAAKALGVLVDKAGGEVVRAQVNRGRRTKGTTLALSVLDRLASPAKPQRQKRSETRRDPPDRQQ